MDAGSLCPHSCVEPRAARSRANLHTYLLFLVGPHPDRPQVTELLYDSGGLRMSWCEADPATQVKVEITAILDSSEVYGAFCGCQPHPVFPWRRYDSGFLRLTRDGPNAGTSELPTVMGSPVEGEDSCGDAKPLSLAEIQEQARRIRMLSD